MKIVLNFFIIFTAILIMAACQGTLDKKGSIIITGKSTGEGETGTLHYKYKLGVKEIDQSKDSFKIIINSKEPVLIRFYFSRIQKWDLYAKPGDSLHFTFDNFDIFNSLGSLSFSGDRVVENNFLIKLRNTFDYESADKSPFFNCSESSILSKIDSLERIGRSLIHQFRNENDAIDAHFVSYLDNYIEYVCAYYVNLYPQRIRDQFAHQSYTESQTLLEKSNSYSTEQ